MKIFSGSKDTSTYYNAGAVKSFLNRKKVNNDYYTADNTFKGSSSTKDPGSQDSVKQVSKKGEATLAKKSGKKIDKERVVNSIITKELKKKSIGIPWSNYIAFMGVTNLADKTPTSSQCPTPTCKCSCSKKAIKVSSRKFSTLKCREKLKDKLRVRGSKEKFVVTKVCPKRDRKADIEVSTKQTKSIIVKKKPVKLSFSTCTSNGSLQSAQNQSTVKLPPDQPSTSQNVGPKPKASPDKPSTSKRGRSKLKPAKSHFDFDKSESKLKQHRSMFDLENLAILERASVSSSKHSNSDSNDQLTHAFGSTIFGHNDLCQMPVSPRYFIEQSSGEIIKDKLSSHVGEPSAEITQKQEIRSFEAHNGEPLKENIVNVVDYDDPKENCMLKAITELISEIEVVKDMPPPNQTDGLSNEDRTTTDSRESGNNQPKLVTWKELHGQLEETALVERYTKARPEGEKKRNAADEDTSFAHALWDGKATYQIQNVFECDSLENLPLPVTEKSKRALRRFNDFENARTRKNIIISQYTKSPPKQLLSPPPDSDAQMTEDSLEGEKCKKVNFSPRKVLRTYKQRSGPKTDEDLSNSSKESVEAEEPVKVKSKKRIHYLTYPVHTLHNNLPIAPRKPLPSRLPILRKRPLKTSPRDEDSKSFVTLSGDTSATSNVDDMRVNLDKGLKAQSVTENKRPLSCKVYSKSVTEAAPKLPRGVPKRRSEPRKLKSKLPVLKERDRSDTDSVSLLTTIEMKPQNVQEKATPEEVVTPSIKSGQEVVTSKCGQERVAPSNEEVVTPSIEGGQKKTLDRCQIEIVIHGDEQVDIIKEPVDDKQTSSTGIVEECLKLETGNQTSIPCNKETGTKVTSLTLIAVTQTEESKENPTEVECAPPPAHEEEKVEDLPVPSITVYNKSYLGSQVYFAEGTADARHFLDNVEVLNYNLRYGREHQRSVTFNEASTESEYGDLRDLDCYDEIKCPNHDRSWFKQKSRYLKRKVFSSGQSAITIVRDCACQNEEREHKETKTIFARFRRSRIPIRIAKKTECADAVASESSVQPEESDEPEQLEEPAEEEEPEESDEPKDAEEVMWSVTDNEGVDIKHTFSRSKHRLKTKHSMPSLSSLLGLTRRDVSTTSSLRNANRDQACESKPSIAHKKNQFHYKEKGSPHKFKPTYKTKSKASIDSVSQSTKKHRERLSSLMASFSRKHSSKEVLNTEKVERKRYWKEFVASFRSRDKPKLVDHCECGKRKRRSRDKVPCPMRQGTPRSERAYNNQIPQSLNISTYYTIFANECKSSKSIEILYPANELNTTETCESETVTIAVANHSVDSRTHFVEMLTNPHHEVSRIRSEHLETGGPTVNNGFCEYVVNGGSSCDFLSYNDKLQPYYHHCTCGQILKIKVIKNSETSL